MAEYVWRVTHEGKSWCWTSSQSEDPKTFVELGTFNYYCLENFYPNWSDFNLEPRCEGVIWEDKESGMLVEFIGEIRPQFTEEETLAVFGPEGEE